MPGLLARRKECAARYVHRFSSFLNSTKTVYIRLGNGKSLCYQLPSLLLREVLGLESTAIVVSPLLSLIEDQVASLLDKGLALFPALAGL